MGYILTFVSELIQLEKIMFLKKGFYMKKFNSNQVGSLQDIEMATSQLDIALRFQSQEDFLFVLQSVALAYGIANLAKETGFGREGLYKILHPLGNPRLSVLIKILRTMGFELRINRLSKKVEDQQKVQNSRTNSLFHAFPALAKQWHITKNRNLSPKDILPTSRKKVWWQCNKNKDHEWMTSTSSLIKSLKIDFCESNIWTEKNLINQIAMQCPFCCGNKKR